jgi:hypothetical protein
MEVHSLAAGFAKRNIKPERQLEEDRIFSVHTTDRRMNRSIASSQLSVSLHELGGEDYALMNQLKAHGRHTGKGRLARGLHFMTQSYPHPSKNHVTDDNNTVRKLRCGRCTPVIRVICLTERSQPFFRRPLWSNRFTIGRKLDYSRPITRWKAMAVKGSVLWCKTSATVCTSACFSGVRRTWVPLSCNQTCFLT